MKILCPSCKAEIPATDINIAKGIAHCKPCNEIVDVTSFQTGAEDIALVEKPSWSRIESFVDTDDMGVIFPPLGFRGITLFFLLFTTFWNGISWVGFISALKAGELGGILFLIPFLAIGLITFGIFLYLLKVEVALLINRETVTLSRTIFGKSFTKVRSFSGLCRVERVECYRSNNRPVYGVGLEFTDEKPLKFGSNLKEEEKDWILSEVSRFWRS